MEMDLRVPGIPPPSAPRGAEASGDEGPVALDQAVSEMTLSHPSPNFGERRGGTMPYLIVLHYTAMDTADAALARLCDPASEVSCHWLIGADGCLFSLVDEEMRAWHAGAGGWGACIDINSASIGIELDNDGACDFPEIQMAALESLLQDTLDRWGILPAGVLGHSDTSPGRKSDPGGRFNWSRLAQRGLSVWPDPARGEATDLSKWHTHAERFGYRIGSASGSCKDPESAAFEAFRSRFRPGVRGPRDLTDLRMIEDLANRFGIDRARLTS